MRARGVWTMSMMWMPMPGGTWAGAAASFVGMWMATMVPMMLPAVAPSLWRHRAAAAQAGARYPGAMTAVTAAGYVAIWAIVGLAAFAVGAAVARFGMDHRAIARAAPMVAGFTVALAGTIQLTRWKARRLAACGSRSCADATPAMGVRGAWRSGARLGLDCVACCGNLMLIPLVVGAMGVGAMAVVAAAIAAERLSSRGARVARITGVAIAAAGVMQIARALGR